MPVDAVRADIQLAADKPFRVREIPLSHLLPWRDPFELAGECAPECLGIPCRSCIDLGIGKLRLRPERFGRREASILLQQRVDLVHGFASGLSGRNAGSPARAQLDITCASA